MKAQSKKNREDKIQSIKDQIKKGHSANYGYLHIPKTGGSGVNEYGKQLVERGHKFPCIFGHGWKVEDILTHFPKVRITFILRDPLTRVISGFNSRLRQGRPTYNSIWTPAEASAFALVPSVRHLLDGMLSDDDFQKSAVAYTMRTVRHLRWNYGFYFKNLETLKSNQSSFQLIGTMDSVNEFIDGLTALSGAPKNLADELYEKRHESSTRTESILDQYSTSDLARIRKSLQKDYRIYNKLLSITSDSPL